MTTFEEAFKGNKLWMGQNLDVNGDLLSALEDNGVLKKRQVAEIKNAGTMQQKVEELLSILERRDAGLFPKFCEALEADDQSHVVMKMTKPQAQQTTKADKHPLDDCDVKTTKKIRREEVNDVVRMENEMNKLRQTKSTAPHSYSL